MHMIFTDQKGFGLTPVDYIFVDLDYKLLKCWHQKKVLSPLKHVMNPKRDIVDPLFHASRMFGRDPTLGLAFYYIWEMGVEGLVNETLNDLMDLNADHARACWPAFHLARCLVCFLP
jgi:hypothetical protein